MVVAPDLSSKPLLYRLIPYHAGSYYAIPNLSSKPYHTLQYHVGPDLSSKQRSARHHLHHTRHHYFRHPHPWTSLCHLSSSPSSKSSSPMRARGALVVNLSNKVRRDHRPVLWGSKTVHWSTLGMFSNCPAGPSQGKAAIIPLSRSAWMFQNQVLLLICDPLDMTLCFPRFELPICRAFQSWFPKTKLPIIFLSHFSSPGNKFVMLATDLLKQPTRTCG